MHCNYSLFFGVAPRPVAGAEGTRLAAVIERARPGKVFNQPVKLEAGVMMKVRGILGKNSACKWDCPGLGLRAEIKLAGLFLGGSAWQLCKLVKERLL